MYGYDTFAFNGLKAVLNGMKTLLSTFDQLMGNRETMGFTKLFPVLMLMDIQDKQNFRI
ncbi:hypothetical protein D3C85_1899350 [compost metagenome]